jgi:hypothetical protein
MTMRRSSATASSARKGAFSRDFAEAMREDMMTAFWDAIQRPGDAIGRGPRRWYVEIHPQMFGSFVEFCSHPWVVAMCEATLGPDYRSSRSVSTSHSRAR